MKKVFFVLVILAAFSASIFAAPLSLAGSLDTSSREIASESFSGFEDLFGDVHAVALTDTEAEAIEGEGWLSGLISAISTAVKVVVNVATGNYVGAGVTAVTGGISSYFMWINPNTP
jgi:hypothetical protein